MHKEAREELRVIFKLAVHEYANHSGVTQTCREFNIPRSTFYGWKKKYDRDGHFSYEQTLVEKENPKTEHFLMR